MRIGKKKIDLPAKIGLTGMAVLWCVAERGALMMGDLLTARRGESLGESLRRIDALKDVNDYYDLLKNKYINHNSAKTILWRLQQKGLVRKSGKKIAITKLGANITSLFKEKISSQPAWDGKWRIVFFDIPESKRRDRQWIYYQLIGSEYRSLQKSVFIGKLPLEKDLMTEILKRDL